MRRGAYSSGVEAPAGRTIYVSGQVSMDAEGNVVGEGDMRLQTETVLEHVKTVVEEAGGGMEDVVKVTVFITDMGLYDEIHEVRRRYFEEPYPASSMVEVSALIDPRLLIEIEAVAVIEQALNSCGHRVVRGRRSLRKVLPSRIAPRCDLL
jgi:2-iminobutanoate/2-iminopropanoate deaminase